MRALLTAFLLVAGVALVPSATAGCWAQVAGLCVQDPCDGPLACKGCTRLVDACVDLDACLDGRTYDCVDATTECLHTTCGPPL